MSDTGLKYLLEALRSGSMRAASDLFNIAPSSVSRQIAQLEEHYGIDLIEKGRRGIRLTRAGEIVIAQYRHQLAEREALRAQLEDLRAARTGLVTLAAGEGFLGRSLTAMIHHYRQENPGVQLMLRVGSSQDIAAWVAEDEAHMGLVFQTPHDPRIQIRTEIDQPLMVIVPPQHRFASLAAVSIADLQDEVLCLSEPSFRLRQIIADYERQSGHFLTPAVTTNSISQMIDMVAMDTALTILPQLSVWAELRRGTMVAVKIREASRDSTTMSLILRSGRKLEGAPLRFLGATERLLRQWARVLPGSVSS